MNRFFFQHMNGISVPTAIVQNTKYPSPQGMTPLTSFEYRSGKLMHFIYFTRYNARQKKRITTDHDCLLNKYDSWQHTATISTGDQFVHKKLQRAPFVYPACSRATTVWVCALRADIGECWSGTWYDMLVGVLRSIRRQPLAWQRLRTSSELSAWRTQLLEAKAGNHLQFSTVIFIGEVDARWRQWGVATTAPCPFLGALAGRTTSSTRHRRHEHLPEWGKTERSGKGWGDVWRCTHVEFGSVKAWA